MKRLIWALVIFVPLLIEGQNKSIFFSADSPQFIPYGKTFEWFALVKFPSTGYDEINLYILPESEISLQDVSIYNSFNSQHPGWVDCSFRDYEHAIKINLQAKDPAYDFGNVFRFKFRTMPVYGDNIHADFAIEYLKKGKVAGTVTSFGRSAQIQPVDIKFYKPQAAAGRCALLQEGASFILNTEPPGHNGNLLAEFWIKMNDVNSEFFSANAVSSGEEIFSAGLNDNGFIYLNDFSRTFYSSFSLSRNSWYHMIVFFTGDKIKFLCNGRLIYENSIKRSINEEEIKLVLHNDSPDSYLYLKQLRIWNFQDDINECIANRQYSFYYPEKSELLYQNLFNEDSVPGENGAVRTADASRIRYVQADAPIISRAPEINVTVFTNLCTIEWSSSDNQKPKNFVVEKSKDGTGFSEVYKTTADEDPGKVYYFSDRRDEGATVIYYRVKQINYDASEIYSSSIKVGQSAKKEVIKVGQNYPNPFNPTTSFTVEMPSAGDAVINVYDLVGKTIQTIYEGTLSKGVHTFTFDGSSLPSGIYLYEIKTPSASIVKKMILTK